ncbi:MAG: hypothetical protein JW779_09220 [Candidatus Thorarchaeota archaeon]|nr:hypothetical protein [Candidatus Thorarchaeota archaeon]
MTPARLLPIASIVLMLVVSFLILPLSLQIASEVESSLSYNISLATYFGGFNIEEVSEVTCASDGSIVMVGHTNSPDLTTTEDAFQPTYSGGQWDIFVVKFDVSGALVFSSFLGGSDYEHVDDVEIRSDGSLIVVGFTSSLDFPVTSDAIQSSLSGETDGYITRISADGRTLLYSTYYGGALSDTIRSVKLDQEENYMIAGTSASFGLSTDGAYKEHPSGGEDLFIARITDDGSQTEMFTYIGGSRVDRVECMAIDSLNNYILTGQTSSQDFPTTEQAYQTENAGVWDAYLIKVSSDGTSILLSTYIGGENEDVGRGVATNDLDEIVVVGYTGSTDLKTLSPLQPEYAGGTRDIFIYKCNKTGITEYLTYLGGSEFDIAYAVEFDGINRPIIIGRTLSDDYPLVNSLQNQRAGHLDTTVTLLAGDGQSILFSTYIGGSAEDSGESIFFDIDQRMIISGRTASSDFPISEGAYQMQIGGYYDVFLCRLQISSSSSHHDIIGWYPSIIVTVAISIMAISTTIIRKWRRG